MSSKTYPAFKNEMSTMLTYLGNEATMTRLSVHIDDVSTLKNRLTQFDALLQKYTDPAQKTAVVTQQAKRDYTDNHRWIATLRQAIKAGNKGKLSEQDYASLFIHEDKTPSKHTRPDTTPTLELNHIEHLNARISAHHSGEFDKGTKPSLPTGVDNIEWQWSISDTQDNTNTDNNHKMTTTATLKLEFTPEQTAKFCHINARYGITNGEVGALSANLVFAIT